MNLLPLLAFFLILLNVGCSSYSITSPNEHTAIIYLYSPFAKEVFLHCSESHFVPLPARRISITHWSSKVVFQTQFSYFFTVDGKVVIPDCAYREQDDFGNTNCIYPTNL